MLGKTDSMFSKIDAVVAASLLKSNEGNNLEGARSSNSTIRMLLALDAGKEKNVSLMERLGTPYVFVKNKKNKLGAIFNYNADTVHLIGEDGTFYQFNFSTFSNQRMEEKIVNCISGQKDSDLFKADIITSYDGVNNLLSNIRIKAFDVYQAVDEYCMKKQFSNSN